MDLLTAARGVGTIWQPQIDDAVARASDVLSSSLIKGVIAAESSWNENAVDPTGTSYGLMQINAAAWNVAPAAALSPEWNISMGSSILADQLRRRGGNVELALAGYNAGTSRGDADLAARLAGNVRGVREYVTRVLEYRDWYLMNDLAESTGPMEIIGDPVPPDSGSVYPWSSDPGTLAPATGGLSIGLLLALGLVVFGVFAVSR